MRTIAITDCDHAGMEEEKRVFSEAGVSMDVYQCHTENELIEKIQGYDVIGNQYAPMTERVFQNLPGLKCVVRYGVGMDHIDIAAATRHGVTICNVPDYGVQEVASQALTFMFALCRKLVMMNASVRAGHWNYELSIPIRRLSRMTVGILGIGRIGSAFAHMIRNLGCRIIAYDPLYADGKRRPCEGVEVVGFETLLRDADVISIHTPLETSRNLVSEEQLRMMKPSAYIINVARGGIINEDALDRALEEKWIAGAACDVLCSEPPGTAHKLLRHENFLCTPHMAWYSEEASVDLKTKLAEEIVRALNGEALHYRLN